MNIRKIISEHIIFEGRIEDAKQFVIQDYQDALIPQSYKEGKRMPEWFKDLVDSDPSGSQKYLMWALKQIKGKTKFHPFTANSFVMNAVIDGIQLFHDLQSKLTPENIQKVTSWKMGDKEFNVLGSTRASYRTQKYPISFLSKIMKAPKDINSYEDPMMFFDIMEAIEKLPTKSDIQKERIKLYDNEYWTVMIPLTHRASCSYGSNTRWCTTSRGDETQFNRYQSKTSSLFYFNSNQELDEPVVEYRGEEWDISKIALHINVDGEAQFFDAGDDVIATIDHSDSDTDILESTITEHYGLDSWLSFKSAIGRAFDYHKKKVNH